MEAARRGSRDAVNQLLPLVYDELRGLADRFRVLERGDHTLQPTAIVHEVYLRLIGQESVGWRDRNQFFAVAAKLMRRILVDHARARRALKRGGTQVRTSLDDVVDRLEMTAPDLPALDETLNRLAAIDARKSRVVELRFFGGLSVAETSAILNVPQRTVERDWTFAKAWLRAELGRD
ncbi:MAG: sigma-70 family RNA polymerase sigma factor [Phycisphaerales bacterium]|nr:sigma-70 family RNA polymerase sigma factor [Phycisphaerales bacterium]